MTENPTQQPARPEAWAVPIEVRTVDEAQRTAVMRVVRYGETSTTAKPQGERFVAGAFTASVAARADRVPFTTAHTGGTGKLPRGATVARPVAWATEGADLLATLRFYDSEDGWAAYWAAKDRKLTGGSVGFRPLEERAGQDGAREIVVGELHHVLLLDRAEQDPAYPSPGILEVRSAGVDALLAVTWDPALADDCVDPLELYRIGSGVYTRD